MSGMFGICKMCLQQKKLVRSHIIPKSFQAPVKGSDGSFYIYHEGAHILQDAQDYLFDKGILCRECDNTFSPSENYTSGFFEGVRTGEIQPIREYIHDGGDKDYYYQPDLFLVKNCLLSILWRMSISKIKQYSSVKLGDLEEILRSRLNEPNLMAADCFPFSILTLKNTGDSRANFLAAFVPSFFHLDSDIYLIHIPDFLIFIHATIRPAFDPSTTSIIDNSTLIISEEKNKGSVRHLNTLYKKLPYDPST